MKKIILILLTMQLTYTTDVPDSEINELYTKVSNLYHDMSGKNQEWKAQTDINSVKNAESDLEKQTKFDYYHTATASHLYIRTLLSVAIRILDESQSISTRDYNLVLMILSLLTEGAFAYAIDNVPATFVVKNSIGFTSSLEWHYVWTRMIIGYDQSEGDMGFCMPYAGCYPLMPPMPIYGEQRVAQSQLVWKKTIDGHVAFKPSTSYTLLNESSFLQLTEDQLGSLNILLLAALGYCKQHYNSAFLAELEQLKKKNFISKKAQMMLTMA